MEKIKEQWEYLRASVRDAIRLSNRMAEDDAVKEGYDSKWALAKYVQDAEEAIKAADNASDRRLLDVLVELPRTASSENELTWRKLIGMRDILVHQSPKTDHSIVWHTASEVFPQILTLIDSTTINVEPTDVENGRRPRIGVSAQKLKSGARTTVGDRMALTGSHVLVFRDVTHGLGALHVGLEEGTSRLVGASPEWARRKWSIDIYL